MSLSPYTELQITDIALTQKADQLLSRKDEYKTPIIYHVTSVAHLDQEHSGCLYALG